MRSLRSQSLVIFTGYVLGAFALYWGLPEQVPPSWTVPSRGTFWLGAPMMAFLLPTAAAVSDVLLRGLCVRHPIGEPTATNVLAIYDGIMLRFIILLMGVHATVLLALLGLLSGREWAAQIVPLMLGLTMISGPAMILLAGPAALVGTWFLIRSSRNHAHA